MGMPCMACKSSHRTDQSWMLSQGPGEVAIRPICPMPQRCGPAPLSRVGPGRELDFATGMFGHWCRPRLARALSPGCARRALRTQARLDFDAGEEHQSPAGTLHGGVLATLVDIAMGLAERSTTDDEVAASQLTVTKSAHGDYLMPGCTGRLSRPPRCPSREHLVVCDADVEQDGRPPVHAVATFAVVAGSEAGHPHSSDAIIRVVRRTRCGPSSPPGSSCRSRRLLPTCA
jgi:acyl-coenzyme A thioesterase PaaI-like protein